MRLIDADELVVMEYGGIKFVPKEFVDEAPTVDAIPITWLEDLHNTAQSEEADRMIDEIISLWEARKK